MNKNLKKIISNLDKDRLVQILLDLSETNEAAKKFIRLQVSGSEEVFDCILKEMDALKHQIQFFAWRDGDKVYDELRNILNLIKKNVSDSEDGVVLLYNFMQLDSICCENVDTDGALEMAFTIYATDMFIAYAKKFQNREKLKEIVDDLIQYDDYGCRSGIAEAREKILQDVQLDKKKDSIYQFYIELEGFEPKIWRRFVIDSDCSMMTLASMIIHSFNGKASHIYNFEIDSKNLDVQIYIDEGFNAEDDDFRINRLKLKPRKHVNARTIKIKECFDKIGSTAEFTYDFGDDWKFTIRREELNTYTDIQNIPWILEGEGLGIIEDCGGVYGLKEIQEIFKQKSGEEYESYCEWLGRKTLNLSKFNIDKVNKSLEKNICKIDRAYWEV